MRRERILIPRPRSSFILVQCNNCGNEQVVFSATTHDIKCRVCGNLLAEKTGGKAKIIGTQIRRLD
ncbi:MAG: 30S ribosomal protein S27e [Nitrososphaerota archaeon]|nr:30S ribosomal protein S27e [Nitrososphaerales archaeon]MDW8045047.1 30S ribosomal protein S27e [Nitrososphaerota archaeon]